MEGCLKLRLPTVTGMWERPVSRPGLILILEKGRATARWTNGRFATLGLAEDTWALNERLIDEGAFLTQAYDIFEERKSHFLDVLKKNKNGFIAIVFDTTDRIQHMFFRYLDEEHPANRGKDTEQYKSAVLGAELWYKYK